MLTGHNLSEGQITQFTHSILLHREQIGKNISHYHFSLKMIMVVWQI